MGMPIYIKPLVDLLASANPGKVATKNDLKAQVTKLRTDAQNISYADQFIVDDLDDWHQLSSASNDPTFAQRIRQSTGHSCLLNACRFALQKRLNVLIGDTLQYDLHNTGDWIVWSIICNIFVSKGEFLTAFGVDAQSDFREEGTFEKASNWLAALGIPSEDPFLTNDFDKDFQQMPQWVLGDLLFVAGKSSDADHTYVLYEWKLDSGHVGAKIYDPGTGAPYQSNLLACPNDVCDVASFLGIDGMRLDSTGNPNPELQAPDVFYQFLPIHFP
jgi:hypothetical protein